MRTVITPHLLAKVCTSNVMQDKTHFTIMFAGEKLTGEALILRSGPGPASAIARTTIGTAAAKALTLRSPGPEETAAVVSSVPMLIIVISYNHSTRYEIQGMLCSLPAFDASPFKSSLGGAMTFASEKLTEALRLRMARPLPLLAPR